MQKKFLLIGWDAADWKILNPLMDAGELPALNQLVETGVVGELMACQPLNTAALWTSVATGKRPWRHGIIHSREWDAQDQQLVPTNRHARRVCALWEILARADKRSLVVGWPATHGSAENAGMIVSDRYSEPTAAPGVKPWPPASPGTYNQNFLANALDSMRVSPETIGADLISQYIPQWKRVDQKRDRRIGQLRVLLTADFSHHAAILHLMQTCEWDFATVRLPAPGHISRWFLPFSAPRRAWINENDFDLYQDVVRMEYRILDRMLGALLQTAGRNTTAMLISAHGVRSPDFPPAGFPQNDADAWKSPVGIITASGPELVQDGLLHGASVLDVVPTILTWFGLPIGDDMEGRVWVEAFQDPPAIQRVASWETEASSGDIAPPVAQSGVPAALAVQREAQWNFTQSCLESAQLAVALPVLEDLFASFPERNDFANALFHCQLNLGRLTDAEATLEVLLETLPPGVFSLLPRAELALAKRDVRQARQLVYEAIQTNPTHPLILRQMGLLLLRLREWQPLAELARAALKTEERDPMVWLGLAEASLRLGQPDEAEAAARRAIQLKYFLPDAHFILARALVAQNKWEQAREAMSAMLKLQPDNRAAAGYNRRLASSTDARAKFNE